MADRRTNWAGNITYRGQRVHKPASVDELQAVIAASRQIRALGTGHSFNTIADSADDQVSLVNLPRVININAERSTVMVGAGVRYGELAQYLHQAGLALRNLGSLPHISVAGACATGTHGSGVTHGNLATAVRGFDLVTAPGDLVEVTRGTDGFLGSVVALGMLGVVSTVTLDVEPTFEVAQRVYEDLPFERLLDNLDKIFAAAYSVSLFTTWRDPLINQVWVKHRVESPAAASLHPGWLGMRLADGPRNPVPGISPVTCTEQLGVAGPWHERLPHFRLAFKPSHGDELQSEYFVARGSAAEALVAINEIRHRIAPVLQISELRTVAADELWMSPCYQRDSLAIHFTWIKDLEAVSPVLTDIEGQLASFAARPHWGKVFNTKPEVIGALYERLDEFRVLAGRYDPTGKFRNDFLDRYVPPL